MAAIRIPEDVWDKARTHLFDRTGEHFAFFLADWTYSGGEPVFMVHDVYLVPDSQVEATRQGWELTTEGILEVINAAAKSGSALIEAHNHGGPRPRFSTTDLEGLTEFPTYVLDSLPGRPYGATVWGDGSIFGEYFLATPSRRDRIRSILVVGTSLRQVVSRENDGHLDDAGVFARQLPWFTAEGQQQLGRFRVGVVGAGGIGAQILQNLVYLGIRDFVIVEDDVSDGSNMNRLVTAVSADLGTPKAILARRMIKSVAPNASVTVVPSKLQAPESFDALKGVDVMFGCVDNDGARLVMNELALAFGIPYLDTAVAVDARGGVLRSAGGRVAVVLPGGPCLSCMGEIDRREAAFFLSSEQQKADQRVRGYVTGLEAPAPSVVSVNGMAAASAVNEFAIYVSGSRQVNVFTEIDLLGVGRSVKSQWVTPVKYERNPSCVACLSAGSGDRSGIDRYAKNAGGLPVPWVNDSQASS